MPRGRKPKPTHLKLIEGNRGKRRFNVNEPEFTVTDIVAPPTLDQIARDEWNRVIDQLVDQGVMTDVDRAALAAYCAAYSQFVRAEDELQHFAKHETAIAGGQLVQTSNGTLVQNPLIAIRNRALEMAVKVAAEFGMTPSSRTWVKVSPGLKPERQKNSDIENKYDL